MYDLIYNDEPCKLYKFGEGGGKKGDLGRFGEAFKCPNRLCKLK